MEKEGGIVCSCCLTFIDKLFPEILFSNSYRTAISLTHSYRTCYLISRAFALVPLHRRPFKTQARTEHPSYQSPPKTRGQFRRDGPPLPAAAVVSVEGIPVVGPHG